MDVIRFKFAPEKTRAALHWMLGETGSVDLHTALKTCYFADKRHLNAHGRPIFGATYRAMRFGPVPLEIYEMAKGEALWLPELAQGRYPWRLDGYKLSLVDNDAPDMDSLSLSDFDELMRSFQISTRMSFDARTAATHGPDWQKAELGFMRYEDMIDEDKRDRWVPYLQENARFMRL
jgi:hypothetical protein